MAVEPVATMFHVFTQIIMDEAEEKTSGRMREMRTLRARTLRCARRAFSLSLNTIISRACVRV